MRTNRGEEKLPVSISCMILLSAAAGILCLFVGGLALVYQRFYPNKVVKQPKLTRVEERHCYAMNVFDIR